MAEVGPSVSKAKVAAFAGSLVAFVVCLLVIFFVYSPTDVRDEIQSKVQELRVAGNSRFYLCVDPADVKLVFPDNQSSDSNGLPIEGRFRLVSLEEFKQKGKDSVTFALAKDGYKTQSFTVPVEVLKQGLWPPLSEPIATLEPESLLRGALLRHPVALALCGLSVLGMAAFGFSLWGEYRSLKDLEALKAENADDPYIATKISEYRVGKLLGKGGYGAVYLAHADGNLRKSDFAIKIAEYTGVNPALDQELKERFEREMYLVKDLEHRNIGRVIDFDSAAKFSWVLMPLYKGGELEQRIKDNDLTREEILHFARGIAEGLSTAHAQGICHRDLKPANVLIDHGEAVIIDFGLARAVDSKTLTMEGAMMGTPIYMPQEQLMDSKSVTDKADQYAYGVMLFEMVTGGKVPFEAPKEGGEVIALVQEKLMRCAKPLREVDPGQSPELEAVLAKMMSSDAIDRYDSIMDAFRAFEAVYKV